MAETEAVMADAYLGDDGAFQEGWLDNLPEDTFEKDDTGALKQGDLVDHKNIGSIVKSYLNKDKMLGSAIQPLPENATDEQIKAHRVKVGCPETVEGYEITKPEKMPEGMAFDEDLMKKCVQYAHDNHVPKTLFEGLAKMIIEGEIETFKKVTEANAKFMKEASDKAIAEAENKLKGKHGAKYDTVLEMANRFYDLPGNDEVNKAFTDLMKEKGLDSHPAVIDFFSESYKMVKGDTIPEGGSAPNKGVPPGQLDYSTVVGNSGR
jgi:hypothetical protein